MKIQRIITGSLLGLLLMVGSCSLNESDNDPAGSASNKSEGKVLSIAKAAKTTDYAADSVLVKINKDCAIQPILSAINATLKKSFSTDKAKYAVIKLAKGQSVSETLQKLQKVNGFILAEPNYVRKHFLTPDDSNYASYQYAHSLTGSENGWDTTTGTSNVTIAILDSGVNGSHPDLSPNMIAGTNVVDGVALSPGDNSDDDGHGTHVAGIAAARGNNSIGIAGVAWTCKIMPVRVLGTNGGSDADIAQGIIWAVDNRGSNRLVINMSLGGIFYNQTLNDAINYAIRNNVIVVVAMGNDSNTLINYPAAYQGVIAVGSTDGNDALSSFSTRGTHISVSAPGSTILSTSYDGTYEYMSGTSMAAPFVSGLCALLLSDDDTLSPDQIKTILEQSSDDLGVAGFDSGFGHGRVNVGNAFAVSASSLYGALVISAIDGDGLPVAGATVLLCDTNTNVLRSNLTSDGTANSESTNGSAFFYFLPYGDYVIRSTSQGETIDTLVTITAAHTAANPLSSSVSFSYGTPMIAFNSWVSGSYAANEVKWYYFDATASQDYSIYWDDSYSGSGTYTGDLKVSAFRADWITPYFTEVDSGYNTPSVITAAASERVYIKVESYFPDRTGTYAVRVTD